MKLRMRQIGYVLAIGLAAGLWPPRHAGAQTVRQQGFQPVDQTVSDVDPSQVSLRREYTGLSTIGERQNVFRRIVPDAGPYNPGSQRLYFVSYGVVAEFDRSQYGLITDTNSDLNGAVIQFIPPNTVFHVGLPRQPTAHVDPNVTLPGMVDGRVDGQARQVQPNGQRVDQRMFVPSQSRVVDTEAARTQRYQEMVVAERGMVVAAIQRVSKQRSP